MQLISEYKSNRNNTVSTQLNHMVLFYESITLGEVKCELKVTVSFGVQWIN
jgi:hypothetical protein